MACETKHSYENLEISNILRELRNIFNECDTQCTGEVKIKSLVDKACIKLQGEENQEILKEDLLRLFSCSGDATTVKRDRFEQCVFTWIETVFENSEHKTDNHHASPPQQRIFMTSTPKSLGNIEENSYIIQDENVYDNEQNIHQHSTPNSQVKLQEEILILQQQNAILEQQNINLEKTINCLKKTITSQQLEYENSPCKKCDVRQMSINELKRNLKEYEDIISRQDELTEQIDIYKQSENRLKQENVKYQKNEEFLQNKVDELQLNLETFEILDKQRRKEDEDKNLCFKKQKDTIEELILIIEDLENKAYSSNQELVSLKNENSSLLEFITSTRGPRDISTEDDESNINCATGCESSLSYELQNSCVEYPRFGYFNASTQTSDYSCKVNVHEVGIQSSVTLVSQGNQTEEDVPIFQTETRQQDFLKVEEIADNAVPHLQLNNERCRKILLICCLVTVVLLTVFILLNYILKLLKSNFDVFWQNYADFFKIQFRYLKPPPT